MGVEVAIAPGTSRFDPDHEGWREQVAELFTALRVDVDVRWAHGQATRGAKGTVDSVVIALGSSGALTAAVACFRAWLASDKTRTLTVTWTDDADTEQRITIAGDNIDQESFDTLAKAVGERLAHD